MYLSKLQHIASNNGKILIIGLGQENKQFLNWLLETVKLNPSQITIADLKPQELAGIKIVSGDTYLEALNQDYDLVVKAPGIWSLKPDLVAYRLRNGHDSIISSLTFFVERFRDSIVMITGTKGKTTTSSWIKHILSSKLDIEVKYCGNTTNISPYQFWTDLDGAGDDRFFVIEASSFQLQDLGVTKLSPKYAVITNLYIDHLDQHSDINEYWLAKDNIYKYQNSEDYLVITEQVSKNLITRNIKPISEVTVVDEDTITLLKSHYNMNLVGDHNWSNLGLAIQVANNINDSEIDLQALINTFEPPKGRLELVRTYISEDKEFRFYNDNTATEPDAVMAAINALTSNDQELVLILSGKVKQGNYTQLAELIKSKLSNNTLSKVFYFGDVGNVMYEMVNGEKHEFESFKEFLNKATTIDELSLSDSKVVNVLFSPAGSSFDEFENYIVRGEGYLNWVSKF